MGNHTHTLTSLVFSTLAWHRGHLTQLSGGAMRKKTNEKINTILDTKTLPSELHVNRF